MVYISKVYTKFGDKGETMLADGTTVPKTAARVQAYGEVDELNATIGLVRLELSREPRADQAPELTTDIDGTLGRVQQELFNLGAELATPAAVDGNSKLKVTDSHIERLEQAIDRLNEDLEPLQSFILPGGGPVGTASHLARTVCRRAERRVVGLAHEHPIRPETQRYLNRLSDYLFVLGRAAARAYGYDEVLWDQENT